MNSPLKLRALSAIIAIGIVVTSAILIAVSAARSQRQVIAVYMNPRLPEDQRLQASAEIRRLASGTTNIAALRTAAHLHVLRSELFPWETRGWKEDQGYLLHDLSTEADLGFLLSLVAFSKDVETRTFCAMTVGKLTGYREELLYGDEPEDRLSNVVSFIDWYYAKQRSNASPSKEGRDSE